MHFEQSTNYDADVLIAGGGPAGSTCAYYLARAGYKVILVDAQDFPRDKVCGDFVGPVAINELEKMGITTHDSFQKTNRISKAALFLDGQQIITKEIPVIQGLPDHGRVIPREILDDWIFRAAGQRGVKMIAPCRLLDFKIYNNAVVSYCKQSGSPVSFTTRLLVGADGSSSVTTRLLNGKKPDAMDRIVAVRAYYENIDCVAGQAELYFTSKSFPGYYWLFPTGPRTANVGVGMVLDNFPHEEINLKDLLLNLISTDATLKQKIGSGKLKDKVVGWPLSTYNPDQKIVGDRVILVGDAAGLINSLNGEGIQYAMQSGRLGAEALIKCLAAGDLSAHALGIYEKMIIEQIGFDMSVSNFVIQFIRNRNFNPVWLKLLTVMSERAKKDESYATIASGILAGLVPANKALSVSFIGKTMIEAFSTLLRDVNEAIAGGPVHVTAMGMQAGAFALSQLASVVQQPGDYWKWMRGILMQSFHLSGHMIRDAKHRLTIYHD